ncbi:helix-turn-helix domain-containing protein [Bacillus spongiae]|uniref:Helix-turn-helix domain-containing protein n=1 Tax=Bacillus spongiae TaxID=2683610 RepID=A0ABU8HI65_9BACI
MYINRKQLIIDAAERTFSSFGYKATTMEQVAKLANVGKGTIYTFFKNKEELFDEIISSMITEMKKEAEDVFDSNLSFYENAHQSLYKILEFRKKHQLMIKLVEEEKQIGTLAVQEVMIRVEDAIILFIEQKVITAIDKKEIRPCDPKLTAFLLLKLYKALIFDWEKRNESLNKEEIAQLFELYFFQGLSIKEN